MTKQVLLSLLVIIAVASLAGVATYAAFSDVETSQDNYFTTGSLDLQLGDTYPYPGGDYEYQPNEDYGEDPLGDSVEATWDYELGYPNGMQPNESLASLVKLRNVGNNEATSLDVSCHNVNTAPPPWDPSAEPGPLDKDTKMIITELVYTCNSVQVDMLDPLTPSQWRIEDKDSDTKITLDDWEHDPIIGLTPPALGRQAAVRMVVLFDPDAGNEYMGCSTMMTLNFDLR